MNSKYSIILIGLIAIAFISYPVKADLLSFHKSGNLFVVNAADPTNCALDSSFSFSQTDGSTTEVTQPKAPQTAGATPSQGSCIAAPPGATYIDLGASQRITSISVFSDFASLRTVVFSGSNTTNANYIDLGSITQSSSGWINFSVSDTNKYRYITLYDSASAGSNERISEIQVFGNPLPNITSWSNTKTNNQNLTIFVHPQEGVIFNATANQPITTWTWILDNTDQGRNASNISVSFFGVGNHTLNVTGANSNGTSSAVNWTINSSYANPPTNGFDPDGFVFDSGNNAIQGAKVVISNATYTDSCILTSCFTDSTGHWAGTIFSNGTYNFNVSKQGYKTLTGSQAFTIGGVNNNFTLTAQQATLSGHVFTTISGTGTTVIQGELKDAFTSSCGIAGQGGTLTIGTSGDGSLYVLKLLDVDSANQQSLWQLFKDGSVLYDNQLVNTGTRLQLKIYENFYETVNVDIDVSNVFQGSSGEFNTATTCGSFEHVSKTDNILGYLANLIKDITFGFAFGNIQSIQNLNALFGDPTNTNPVHFNASAGHDAVLMGDFHVNNRATISNFNMAFKAASTTANAGKIEIGYTDNTQTQPNGYTDVLLINSLQSCQANGDGYCTPQHDFKSVDANGDGTIRVWVKLDSGFSELNAYTIDMNAWGTTTQQPLPGASVYSMNSSNATTTTDALGFYNLLLPLSNNTVVYQKIGYETKTFNFQFNNSNTFASQDVILNATNATINTTKEYIIVPNFVQGTQTQGNFKTLSHTSLIGGYQIAICPQLGTDCTHQDVPANTESTFALDPNLPIGTYQADLTGYLGGLFDINRVVIVSTNFTVTSSTPHVDWLNGASGYYLGDTMVLGVYVPSSTANVNVTYLTNGSAIYGNTFSATGTVQNVSFQTNSNASLNQFPPGTYQGCITGGNCVTTTLLNVSNSDYELSSPTSVVWGNVFNIMWKSPHTSVLQVTNQSKFIIASVDVGTSGLTGITQFDTSTQPNQNDVLTIQLIRNNVVIANTTTIINPTGGANPSNNPIGAATSLINVLSQVAFYGLVLWLGIVFTVAGVSKGATGQVSTGAVVFVGFLSANFIALIGLFDPFKIYVLVLSWLIIGVYWRMSRDATTGG